MGYKENELNGELQKWASAGGGRLLRNNSGTAFMRDGSTVQYGVGNPGGSDLIGFHQVKITPEMVGKTVAVFFAVEAKTGKLKPTEDQRNFIDMVMRKGGIGLWGRSVGEIAQGIELWLRDLKR